MQPNITAALTPNFNGGTVTIIGTNFGESLSDVENIYIYDPIVRELAEIRKQTILKEQIGDSAM